MRLTKIKLINWHIFSNHTIELDGNVLITGENASGKSTLMDAIYFVLSGGDTKNFNKAANDSGQRTVESYLRGKLGNESQMFLRSGTDVVGYLLLEFVDKKNNHHVLGAELEIVGAVCRKPKFFVIDNYSINDNDFFKEKIIIDYRELNKTFKLTKHPIYELSDTNRDRKRQIARDFFKLDNYNRFFELLQRSLAFKPILEVSSFVNEFLLDEENINLDDLRNEIRSYQEIHKLLIKEEDKINALSDFTPKAEKYISNFEEMNYLKAMQNKVRIDKANNQIKRYNIDIERMISENKNYDNEITLIRDEEKNIDIEIYRLENNEAYKALNDKKKRLLEQKNNLNNAEINLNSFINKIVDEQRKIRKLDLDYRFDEDIKKKDFGLLKAHLTNYKEELDNVKTHLTEQIGKNTYQVQSCEELLKEKEKMLFDLKKGIQNYPSDIYNLIDIAKNAITSAFPREKDPDVRPFCEYIEIKDEKWTNALEGYLNTQRFNLIFDPKYYDVVAVAYNKYKNERRTYVSGIVNVNGISVIKQAKKAMMDKIIVGNKFARKYAEYLLGNLVCVDDVNELKKYDASITPEVMIYKNHVLKACKPEVYKTPFIGKSSREKRIKILENDTIELKFRIENLRKEYDEIISKVKECNSTNIGDLLSYDDPWNKLILLENSVVDLSKQIEQDGKESGLMEIDGRIKNANERINVLKQRNVMLNKKKDDNTIKIGTYREKISFEEEKLNRETEQLKTNLSNLDRVLFETKCNDYTSNGWLKEEKIEKDYYNLQSSNNSVKTYLINTMSKYSTTYKPALTPLIENLNDYIQEYYKVLNSNVVDYKQSAKEAYERAESSFKEDFLSKLKEKIEKSQKMLDKLNKTLKTHPFGNDEEIYKFSYEPTKDSEFYNYYRIIMSGKLMETKDLFTEILDEKDYSFIRELFDKISMETNGTEAEKELQRYLDYRNYMSYDIKIINKYGEQSFFSKINKEKSGGETQTPFYIVMASCFEELMNKDNKIESTCQVVFDEAFNNMDEGRIKSLMEFYKNLNIQVIIVVPSNRIMSISPYMDTMIGITKVENYPYIIKAVKSNG